MPELADELRELVRLLVDRPEVPKEKPKGKKAAEPKGKEAKKARKAAAAAARG